MSIFTMYGRNEARLFGFECIVNDVLVLRRMEASCNLQLTSVQGFKLIIPMLTEGSHCTLQNVSMHDVSFMCSLVLQIKGVV